MHFLWTIKINCRWFSGRLSTNVMTLSLIQIHSETNIFLSTKVIWEREKRGFISYLLAWGSDRRVCLKILPSYKNLIYLWKMAMKVEMCSQGIKPLNFGFCTVICYHWATETLEWAKSITKFIWHTSCILLGSVISIASCL